MNNALLGGDFNLAEMNMEIYEDGGSVIQRLEQFTGVAGEFH
jgi:hypothetical protein